MIIGLPGQFGPDNFDDFLMTGPPSLFGQSRAFFVYLDQSDRSLFTGPTRVSLPG